MNDTKSVLVCIQARMGSKRLPGKSLAVLEGKTSLEYLIESVCCSVNKEQIIVLSSINTENIPIKNLCENLGIHFFAGDEDNVASRFSEVIQKYAPKWVLRLNGDSPLWDHRVIQDLLNRSEFKKADLYSTVGENGYPSGANAELIRSETFLKAYPKFNSQEDFEHVTRYFYNRPEEFSIERIPCPFDFDRGVKLSLDTEVDFRLLEKFFRKLVLTNKKLIEITLEQRIKIIQNLVQSGENS